MSIMTIDTRTKAQRRAEEWAKTFEQAKKDNPEASNWKICQAIAEQAGFTPTAVYHRLKLDGKLD